MQSSIGVNLRVTAHSNQGGRKYMEDMFCVAYQPTADERDLLYAYFGIFDGHGGREAASYAKAHLMDYIVSQKNFWSDDDELVMKAIREGFIATHYAMWKELEKWPKTASGLPSTSGTTASIVFVRRGKMYIGHVGDSGIILGIQEPGTAFWRAKPLTRDHKPECETENARITQCGGKVISKSGVPRVVWNRPRIGHKGPVRRSTHIDEIPFLAVARSLGDLWSYNSAQNEFVVSPEPDVSVIDIDVNTHRCIILGSDGLWNMLNPQDAVNSVFYAERNNERQLLSSPPDIASGQVKNWINPSKRLVDRALDRWYNHNLRADNTSVVTVVIDPPGPPRITVLRQNQNRTHVVRQSVSSVTDPATSKTVPAMVLAPISGPKPSCASNNNINNSSNINNNNSNGLAPPSSFANSRSDYNESRSLPLMGRTHRSRMSPPSSSEPVNTLPLASVASAASSSSSSGSAPSAAAVGSSSIEKCKSSSDSTASTSGTTTNPTTTNSTTTTTSRSKLKRKFESIGKSNSKLPESDVNNSPDTGTSNSLPSTTSTDRLNRVESNNISQSSTSSSKSQNQDDVQIHEISSSSESSDVSEAPAKKRKIVTRRSHGPDGAITTATTTTTTNDEQKDPPRRPLTRNSCLSTTSSPSLMKMKKIDKKSKLIKKVNTRPKTPTTPITIGNIRKSATTSATKTTNTTTTTSSSRKLINRAKKARLSAPPNIVNLERKRPSASSLKTPESKRRIPMRPKSVPTSVPTDVEKSRSLRSDVKNSKRMTRSMKK